MITIHQKRTKGTWKVNESSKGWLIESPFDDGPIAEVSSLIDAEFIVRACNSHDDLLKELEELATIVETAREEGYDIIDYSTTKPARQVIAKTKPKGE